MCQASEGQQDRRTLQVWLGNQALILQARGRPEEALALHKEVEAICLELGDKDHLQVSYGNQAVILHAWGRLEEALGVTRGHARTRASAPRVMAKFYVVNSYILDSEFCILNSNAQ